MKWFGLLVLLSLPAHASIIAGNEQPVAPVTIVPGGGASPVIASAGPDSLVAWTDALGIKSVVIGGDRSVSPIPSRRVHRGNGSSNLAVVWTGSAYLATWSDGRVVMAATLARNGALIAEHVIDTNGPAWPALAWNGRHALLVTLSGAFLLDADGNAVKRNIAVADLPQFAVPRIVAVNDVFFVFWTRGMSQTTLLAARVSDVGVSLDVAGAIITVTEQITGNPGVAFDGRTLAVSLLAVALPGKLQTLHRYLVDPQTFAATALPDLTGYGFTSNMLWSGSAFVVYWSDFNASGYRFETVSFTANDSTGMHAVVDGLGQTSDVIATAAGSAIVMAWTDHARGGSDVMALTLTPDGKSRTSDKFFVAYGPQPETLPAIAPGLVVWGNVLPSGLAELFASRIGADGTTIGAPMQLSTSGHVGAYAQPLVVFTGSVWLVAWNEGASFTRRIALDGTLLDPQPVSIGSDRPLSIAFNGSTILMPCATNSGDLTAKRFDANGKPIDMITIAPKAYTANAQAASNGRDFLVAWTVGSDYWQFPSKDLVDVIGARVSANGTVVDTTPIDIATGPADQGDPHVASNGSDYLVSYFVGGNVLQTMLQRVSRDGYLDGAAIPFGDATTTPEAIAGNATGYWIASRNDVAHLDASGVVSDRTTMTANDTAIALLGDAALVAYSRFDPASEATRVVTRHLTTALLHGRAAAH